MAKNTRTTIQVSGMTCAACASRVTRSLLNVEGVTDAQVNFATGTAAVLSGAATDSEHLMRAIESAGYEVSSNTLTLHPPEGSPPGDVRPALSLPGVRSVTTGPGGTLQVTFVPSMASRTAVIAKARAAGYRVDATGAPSTEEAETSVHWRVLGAALLSAPVLAISMVPAWAFTGHQYVLWALATPVVFWAGESFFRRAFTALRHRSADMNSLVALGVGSAYLYSVVATLWPRQVAEAGTAPAVYFEAAAVIVTLVLVGRMLERRARQRTHAALKALMVMQPATARVMVGHQVEDRAVEDLRVGDRVVIRPGERIPIDGQVTEGAAAVNESMITGEPLPVRKAEGDPITGGTLLIEGALVARVTHIGRDTVLQQIIQHMREAQGRQAPVQRLADKVCAVFVPAVLVVAAATLVGWLLWGPEPALSRALVAFVSVLIIACPCALGLATPTAIVVATGAAARHGVHFKGADAVERAAAIGHLVVDKTGTLTEGRPMVQSIRPLGDRSADHLLQLVASIEVRSQHPVGIAIVEEAAQRTLALLPADDFEHTPGMGVGARVDGRYVIAGNATWLRSLGVPTAAVDRIARQGARVLVAIDGRLAGVIAITDRLRTQARPAISMLRSLGVNVTMATGDTAAGARPVAEAAGIRHIEAGILPDGKARIIRALQSKGDVVAMVGDGINDGPALAESDVGIALGAGTHVAIEAADVTLMRNDLRAAASVVSLSRKTMRIIRQNLFFAFIYNAVGIPIAAGALFPAFGVLLSPMIASGAMALSSVSVVANSLRLRGAIQGLFK